MEGLGVGRGMIFTSPISNSLEVQAIVEIFRTFLIFFSEILFEIFRKVLKTKFFENFRKRCSSTKSKHFRKFSKIFENGVLQPPTGTRRHLGSAALYALPSTASV